MKTLDKDYFNYLLMVREDFMKRGKIKKVEKIEKDMMDLLEVNKRLNDHF
tara:strand:+ start:6417 stop:6566 length:150 start_codon:yes stop_codon:yes gene_type:complete